MTIVSYPENSYSGICFHNISFGVDAAHAAAPILTSLRERLTEVILSNIVAGRSVSEAMEVMEIFSLALEGCSLKTLDLSNNSLGRKGVWAYSALLKSQSNLEELYLMNDDITKEAARAVTELIPSTERLKVLHFYFNRIEASPSLEDFCCATSWIGSKGGVALIEALGRCRNLKKLDPSDNMFGMEAGKLMATAFLSNAGLTEVHLGHLNLQAEGAIKVGKALMRCAPSLEVLDMSMNGINPVAAVILAKCVASKQFLTKLNLSGNRLTDTGAFFIGDALADGHDQLTEVDMSGNFIRKDGATCLARAVAGKPRFALLNINDNCISEEGINDVKVIYSGSPSMLGPLDENDPNGEDDEWDEDF
ncbi:RAN GTPase-activating protein 2-like [Papaver somniferum]|uniref:RAN GTPase-activating protein 2-like n=1 Tax=Papaver somniferum TaxID=3469 RepID=UPI000E6FD5CF|nr:RAN GTPase-activating protein 2-like [Papaver somniferum]